MGVQNQQVFDLNLRKGLGKTKVNKDIYKSIEDQSEHQNFLLYHNGITIVCNHLDTSREDQIKIKNYAVVNGCQSVSCLYEKREEITQDLKILTRIVEVQPDSDLIAQITYNSNNQNGIKVRDFRSNTATQIRLQKEINQDYPNYFYQIKTGERIPDNRIGIDNQLAGRILLVFDLKEPWAVQGIVKMFEDSHSRIFARPEVTGGRIVTLFKLYQKTNEALEQVKPELFRSYQITGFMILYLVSKVLSEDKVGRKFCANPVEFCRTPEHEQSLFESVEIILSDLTEDLSFEFEERGGEDFDFKKTYKSPNMLRELATEVIQSYKKLVKRGKAQSFSELWKEKTNS